MSTNEIKQPWLSNDAFLRWARPIFHALYNTWVMTGPPPPTKRIHLDENGMTPASDQETMKCVPWEEDEPTTEDKTISSEDNWKGADHDP